jgi:predicted DNA binding CopG/RHH family protein
MGTKKGQRKIEVDDDAELWESKQLGASAEHARRVSSAESKQVDYALGLQAISIRLQKELVEQLKELARRDGIGYQPYIRQLLTRHVRETSSQKSKRESA